MTNHIEELMKAAGVSKYRHFRQYNYAQVPHGEKELQKSIDAGIECVDVRNCKDNDCIYWNELHYPKFTPAKQLELIKLLAKRKGYSCIGEQIDYFTEIDGLTFENAIAQITSNAISSKILNKSEVKRILEDAN